MIKLDAIDRAKGFLEFCQEFVPLLTDPQKIEGAIQGIAEAKKVLDEKNKVLADKEIVAIWTRDHEAKEKALLEREGEVFLRENAVDEALASNDKKSAELDAQAKALRVKEDVLQKEAEALKIQQAHIDMMQIALDEEQEQAAADKKELQGLKELYANRLKLLNEMAGGSDAV